MYQESDLIRIAKRENNTKRNYLVVNCLQGKHMPVRPGQALAMFEALAGKLQEIFERENYEREHTLLIGFAETATAIGAAVAAALGTYYIQTTRETIKGAAYLYFSEVHSHATQQRLITNELSQVLPQIRQVVFIEDEITTGNTIRNLVHMLKKEYPGQRTYVAASIINGMDEQAQQQYQSQSIQLCYLVKTDHTAYPQTAEQFVRTGVYLTASDVPAPASGHLLSGEYTVSGRMDARRLVDGRAYKAACLHLWEELCDCLHPDLTGTVLVLGTEEFMYPALLAAEQMEQSGVQVRFHATTRSPIAVFAEESYPLHVRYELPSLYDKNRRTFVYDIGAYDAVLIVTDAWKEEREGLEALARAAAVKNKKIYAVRWCR